MNLDKNKHVEIVTEVMSIVIIIASFFVLMLQFRVMAFLGDRSSYGEFELRPKSYIDFQFWVQLEVYYAFAIVFGNVLYLLLRSCFRNTTEIAPRDYESKKYSHDKELTKRMRENTDYLKGVYLFMSIFVIFSCPLFVNIMILVLDDDNYRKVLITPTLLKDDQ